MRTDGQLEGGDQLLTSKDDETPITVRVALGKNATTIHVVPNYRGAVRDPSIMHVSGMESQGTNPDLTEHLFAKKANPSNQWFSPESGYVSTSESMHTAQKFAEQRLKGSASGEAYIYEINPRGDAIHVQEFLQGELKAGRITKKEYFWIVGQKEISYPLKIESQDIKGAHRVVKSDVNGVSQISRGDYIPNPHYVAPLARTRAVIQAGGAVATAVGLASDAGALCYAYHESSESGDYTHLFKEGARVVGGWSGALAVGGAYAEFATAHIAPALSKACARTVFGLYLAPLGPVASLAGVVVPSLVGSVAGSVVGGELAKKAVPFLREIFTAENIFAHLVPSILNSQLQGETKIDVPRSEKKVAERGPDAVSQYQNLLGATMRETQGFYRSAQKQTEALREKKEALARAREIDMKKIRLTDVTADILNKEGLAKDAYEKYVAAVRAKESAAMQAALGRAFVQSTAAFGDAVSKNLSNAGYRTAGRVLSTVSNGLSAGLAAKSMGAAIGGLTKCAALGTATAGIGIAIAAFTTILGLCGDDDVSRSSNGLSELAAHLDGRFDRVESLIQKSTDAIRSDIRVLQQLMIQVFSEVRQLSTICLETLQSLYELNHFVREEAAVTAAQLKSIETHPLKFAQFMLEQYLVGAGKLPDQASFDMMKFWLVQNLHEPVINASNCAHLSSERVTSMLQKQAEKNIVMPGFLALRLHQHFPHLNFDVYAALPPMPLFLDLSDLYLNALEKSGKAEREDYVSVCEKTKTAIKLYLQFINTLKKNPEVTQALFDQYAYYQRKNDKQYFTLMAKIKGLLQNIVPLLENKKFEEKLVLLNEKAVVTTPVDIWDQLPKTLKPTERVKKLFDFLNQDKVPSIANSKYILLPEGMTYRDIPAQITWAPYASPTNESTSSWGSTHFPLKPKSPVFSNNHLLLLSLASGYVDLNYCRKTTLKNHVAELISKCPPDTYERKLHDAGWERIGSDGRFMNMCGSPYDGVHGYPHNGGFMIQCGHPPHYEFFRSNEVRSYSARYQKDYVAKPLVYSSERANIFEFYKNLPNESLPLDYLAILESVEKGFLKAISIAFKYVVLVTRGDLLAASTFIEKNGVDHTALLFLAAVVDRFDIFETYVKQKTLPLDFNAMLAIGNAKITAKSIAEQLGHIDVVSGINGLVNKAVVTEIETSEEKRLNAQLLVIADYEAEFLYSETHQEPIVDPVKEAHESEETGYQRGLEIGNAMALNVIASGLQQAGFAKAADILLAGQKNPLETITVDSFSSAENKGFLQAVSAKVVKASACLLKAKEIEAVTWLTEFSDAQIEKSLRSQTVTNALLGDVLDGSHLTRRASFFSMTSSSREGSLGAAPAPF